MKTNSLGPIITVKKDQRITTIGKLMRRLKVDEIPQIFNVLIGDLNFVGPRPEVSRFVHKQDFFFLKEIKPGLTDFSSILFSNEEKILFKLGGIKSYNDLLKIKLEIIAYYLEVRSFWVDLKIVIFTIASFFAPETINKIIKKEIYKYNITLFNKITEIGL
jgi:lipopolysaccharide/colanic/teichoic acid biosynthesis glycosyltransferase